MAYKCVRFEVRDGVAIVTLNRPDALNSLTDEMKGELLDAFKTAERDEAVRAVVLTGEGRGFCAGEALNDEMAKSAEPPPLGDTLRTFYNPLIEKMRAIEKPVIAAVNGTCAGAGVSLALAADIRLASDKASFIEAFVKIGLVPDAGGTFFLPRLVGLGKAMEMCMTGDKVDAVEAEKIGLVNRVVP
ncbi:MAG: enoyl-CoA hydratase-related protein, partial [Candidatus Binatia bacterium]